MKSNWKKTRLKYRLSIICGNGFVPELQGRNEGDYPFCKCSDISAGGKIKSAENFITKADVLSQSYNLIPKGSVLVAKIGESMKKNRRALSLVPCCIDNNMQAFVPDEFMDQSFSYYLLSLIDFSDFDNGGPVPSLNNQRLMAQSINIPSKEEQGQIANHLDKTCSKLDLIISTIEKQISFFERYRASIIHEAVTKGLDPTISTKPSGVDWIGSIPSSWVLEKLNNVAELYGRIGWQGLTADEYQDEGPWLVTGTDFKDGKVDWNTCVHISEKRWEEAHQIKLQPSDLLITKDGTVGKLAIVENQPGKASLNSGIMRVVPRSESDYSTKYLYYVLQTDVFKEWFKNINAGASTIQHLFQKDFKHFVFPKPPLQKQIAIANYLDNKCATIDAILDTKRNQIDILKRRRQSLIYEYVTGKRRVRQEL